MARQAFLADNSYRNYPLLADVVLTMAGPSGDVVLPRSLVVDFRALVGTAARWQGSSTISLVLVARVGDAVTLGFTADSEGLVEADFLTFTRTSADPEFAVETRSAEAPIPGVLQDHGACVADLLWEATLTTGPLDELLALLDDGDTWTAPRGRLAVEPALVQDLTGTYVNTINLANAPRTRATPAEGCGPAADPEADLTVKATCLHGVLVAREGFNCSIRQNTRDTSLTIGAAVAAGAGVPCEEIPLDVDDEVPPEGSVLLSGGPSCGALVSSINGQGATDFRINAGPGVTVSVPGDDATVLVDVDLHDLAGCPTP